MSEYICPLGLIIYIGYMVFTSFASKKVKKKTEFSNIYITKVMKLNIYSNIIEDVSIKFYGDDSEWHLNQRTKLMQK